MSFCRTKCNIYILAHWFNALRVRLWLKRPGFNRMSSRTKDSKWYSIPTCLTLNIIRYVSRVEWIIQGKEKSPSPYRCVAAIEMGTIGSPLTTVVNITIHTHTHTHTHIYIYIYIYIDIHRESDSLYHNSSVRLDTLGYSSWDRNPPNFTLDPTHIPRSHTETESIN